MERVYKVSPEYRGLAFINGRNVRAGDEVAIGGEVARSLLSAGVIIEQDAAKRPKKGARK